MASEENRKLTSIKCRDPASQPYMAWVTPGMVAREISRRLGIILPTKCVGLVTSFRESDTAIPLTKARTGFDQRHIHIGGGGRDADRRDRRLGSGRDRKSTRLNSSH